MHKRLVFILFILVFSSQYFSAYCAHDYSEAVYQKAWCDMHNGITEVKNPDKTRIDCLTKTHAVEFDFATKWAEGVGQALYYGMVSNKKPKVVLILENPLKEMVYFKRIKKLSQNYNFDVEYVTKSILK